MNLLGMKKRMRRKVSFEGWRDIHLVADRISTLVVVPRNDGGDDGEDVESSSSIPSDRDDDQV